MPKLLASFILISYQRVMLLFNSEQARPFLPSIFGQ